MRLGIFAFIILALPALAQTPSSDVRTPDGRPDLHGVWTSRWTTPLERSPGTSALVISKAEGDALHREFLARLDAANPLGVPARDLVGPVTINGEVRSSLIVAPLDGRLPYTDEGRARRSRIPANGIEGADGPEQRNLTERCLMSGNGYAPFMTIPGNNIRQIVQTAGHIVLYTESYNQLRIIPLNGGTGPRLPRGGVSAGRWEGDVLVIETTGFPEGDRYRSGSGGATFPISPLTRITERLTRMRPDEILYRFTIEDPALYTQAWTAESLLKRTNERTFEFACHEGDYSMIGILGGARADEQRRGKSATPAAKP